MIDPYALIPSAQETRLQPFGEKSRYRGLPLLVYVDADGREIVYVSRRWIPPPELFADIGRYQVREGDRIDNIAAALLGDPERTGGSPMQTARFTRAN